MNASNSLGARIRVHHTVEPVWSIRRIRIYGIDRPVLRKSYSSVKILRQDLLNAFIRNDNGK